MVGLTLALLLAQEGVASVLCESAVYPEHFDPNDIASSIKSFDGRNTALSRRTVDIYQQLGVWDLLAPYAAPIYDIYISEQDSFGKAKLHHASENVDHFGMVVENSSLGKVLLHLTRTNPLITLLEGVQLAQLQQHGQQVDIILSHNGTAHALQCSLLIAADGKHSTCRKLLGVQADSHHYQQAAIVCTVQTDRAHAHAAFERFSPQGPIALLPLADPYKRSLVWTVAASEAPAWQHCSEADFIAAIQHCFGGRAGLVTHMGKRHCYPLEQILAERQAIGNVVLMGNAAHTLHPVAGQGFNLCVRDAHVISSTINNIIINNVIDANMVAEFLKTYESSRLADQKRVIAFCHHVVTGFGRSNSPSKLLRNVGLVAFDLLPMAKPLVANYAMGLKI